MKMRVRGSIVLFTLSLIFISSKSMAACSNPTGVEGQMIYNIDYKVVQFCNDTDWIAAMDRKAFGQGDCTNPVREEGAIIYNEAQNVPQVCIGEWIALGPLNPSAGTGGCSNPTRVEGRVIYNQTDKVMQYCDGSQYVKLQGSPPVDLCGGVTTPGDACPDGSLYAGNAPIGNVRFYTTRCDLGQTWDGANCTGSKNTYDFNNGSNTGYVDVPNASSDENGQANHNQLIATDSDSGMFGKQPHLAAQACEDLVENGHDDWYLPAPDEHAEMYINRVAIGNFETGSDRYWTSDENNSNTAFSFRYDIGNNPNAFKTDNYRVRCIRK